MEIKQKTHIYLYVSAVLIFGLGYMVATLVLSTTVSEPLMQEVVVPAEVIEVNQEPVAPEDYEPVVFTHASVIELPAPVLLSEYSVEAALQNRRSFHEYEETDITIDELGQMLWSAQGITDERGGRTAPSARRVYPSRVFVVVHRVDGLEPGLYEYLPEGHRLGFMRAGEFRSEYEAMTAQTQPLTAAAVVLQTANMSDESFRKLALQESGHIGQNMYVQAESLGLGMTVMGGFDAEVAGGFLGTDSFEEVVYMIPFGNRPSEQ